MSSALPQCVLNPLGTVAELFDAAASAGAPAEDADWGVRSRFNEALSQPGVMSRVPEINAVGVDNVPPGALVRFRCMVQDMYNPEYYVGAYRDASAGGRWRTTKYTEDLGPEDDRDGPCDRKIWERRVLYCVPLPGESAWVRRLDGAGAGAPPRTPSKDVEPASANKRARDMDLDVDMDAGSLPLESGAHGDPDRAPKTTTNTTTTAAAAAAAKRANLGVSSPSSLTFAEGGAPTFVVNDGDDAALNLPLGSRARDATNDSDLPVPTPCIVKMYGTEDADDVKLNDVLEIVGVLAIAPNIAAEAEAAEAAGMANAAAAAAAAAGEAGVAAAAAAAGGPGVAAVDFMDEERAHNPPTSVVPRFHALVARRATPHGFATLPRRDAAEASPHPRLTPELRARGAELKSAIVAHLAAPLGGDALAAEYVLSTLVSRVHSRTDAMALGKHGTTLLGAPEGGFVARALAAAIAQIAPCVAHLPLSISSLNARPWTPRKDYATNRLRSGPLQLAPGTALVLDETALTAGQLGEIGVRNIHALRDLVATQELEYDFQYHQMRVPVDVAVVTVSASRRDGVIQGADARVPLRMIREPAESPELDETLRAEMREFVARARGSDHSIDAASSAEIESAMVAARSGDEKITQETFHRWLTMARLAALSGGETELTIKHWNRAMECERTVEERMRVC
jgi:hypothetical protein